jgi:hypothetical protein
MARRRSAPSNWTNLIPRQSNFSYRLYYFGKREDEHRRVGRVQTAGLLFQRGSIRDAQSKWRVGVPYAGHTDWRLPIVSELQSILVGPGVTEIASASPADPASGLNLLGQSSTCSQVPCIDPDFAAPFGGPRASQPCWSSCTYPTVSSRAWFVAFYDSPTQQLAFPDKGQAWHVRAVRTGS